MIRVSQTHCIVILKAVGRLFSGHILHPSIWALLDHLHRWQTFIAVMADLYGCHCKSIFCEIGSVGV